MTIIITFGDGIRRLETVEVPDNFFEKKPTKWLDKHYERWVKAFIKQTRK